MPTITEALRTGVDPRTGKKLSWSDFTKTVEVVSRISMPAQSQVEVAGDVGAPWVIEVLARRNEPVEIEVLERPRLLPRAVSSE